MSPPTLIIIPARMAAKRLPGKPLADIGGVPMIVRVWQCAKAAQLGDVLVAAGEQEICDAVAAAGGTALLTDANLPSGSDRIYQALQTYDPDARFQTIINLQGDLPMLEPALMRQLATLMEKPKPLPDMATLVHEITDETARTNPDCVKAVVSWSTATDNRPATDNPPAADSPPATDVPSIGRALYFTRTPAPYGDGPLYQHIGIYAYQRTALAAFVARPPSVLEQRERLEQLRALEAGMHIRVACVKSAIMSVDTPADLAKLREYFAASGKTAMQS